MEALLGRGVDGWSLEPSDGFGLRGGGGPVGARSRPGLTPRGSASISSDRSPIGPLTRRSRAAAPLQKKHFHHDPAPGTPWPEPANSSQFFVEITI